MDPVMLTPEQKHFRGALAVLAFILFIVFVVGMFFVATSNLDDRDALTRTFPLALSLSFIAGLSMIFLPCTLPLVFIIVPLSIGSGYKKGFLIALLFGLGLSVTLSIYGIAIAALGGWLGLATATEYMFLVAGIFAFMFGLAQLKFINLRIPGYGGKVPDVIQKQGDYLKSFFLGLFLGNAGVGCPNPAFYILLWYIATTGDVVKGWELGFVHGVGRAVPLIFISILAILGVNATGWLVSKKEKVERMIGWFLVYIGAFIFMNGAFGHEWYVQSGIHGFWEKAIAAIFNYIGLVFGIEMLGGKFGELVEHHHDVISSVWYRSGNWVMVMLFAIPLVWNYYIKKKELGALEVAMPRDEGKIGELQTKLGRMFWKYTIIIFLFIVFFVRVIPATVLPPGRENAEPILMKTSAGYDRAVTLAGDKYTVNLELSSPVPVVGVPVDLTLTIKNKADSSAITNVDVVHERPMHLVIVRDDLTQFTHVHPELRGNSYVVSHVFLTPGKYKMWADVTYQGETHIVDFLVDTEGAMPNTLIKNVSSEGFFGGYTVRMSPVAFSPEKHAVVTFEARRPDGSMPAIGMFLGARGHLVGISENLAEFVHVHAEGGHDNGHMDGKMDDGHTDHTHGLRMVPRAYAGPGHGNSAETPANQLQYGVMFSAPGFYKLWPQFVADGNQVTGEFLVEVK